MYRRVELTFPSISQSVASKTLIIFNGSTLDYFQNNPENKKLKLPRDQSMISLNLPAESDIVVHLIHQFKDKEEDFELRFNTSSSTEQHSEGSSSSPIGREIYEIVNITEEQYNSQFNILGSYGQFATKLVH